MIRQRTWAISLFIAVMLSPLPTYADSVVEEAIRQNNEGTDLHAAFRFGDALPHYRKSYELHPNPNVWANIVLCLVDMGETVQAIAEFDAHVTTDWVGLSKDSRTALAADLFHIGQVMGFGFLEIEPLLPGPIFLDGEPLRDFFPNIPRRLPAGKYVIRLEAAGMAPTEEVIMVRSGELARIKLSPRRPFHLEIRFGIFGGGTTTIDNLVPDNPCSVYCFPGLSTFVGLRLSIPLKNAFVAQIGGDYLHEETTVRGRWPGVLDRDIASDFSLDAAIVHASTGMDVTRGSFRWQWRIGAGFLGGQHFEKTHPIAAHDGGAGPVFRAALLARIGLSYQIGRWSMGAGLAGIFTLGSSKEPYVPDLQLSQLTALVGPHDNPCPPLDNQCRPLGQVLVISPEISVGTSF